MVDPISDMLTQIRNAQAVKKETVTLGFSKLKMNLAKVLKKEGFVKEVEKIKERIRRTTTRQNFIKITLSYANAEPVIKGLKMVSKPGQRIYVTYAKISRLASGLGVVIISTSKGLMIGKEARKKKLGGEVICEVW